MKTMSDTIDPTCEALHMQQVLTAVIVHDIKTPLRYFMWTAKSLQEDLEQSNVPETFSERAQILHTSAERMHTMVESLLRYARVQLKPAVDGCLPAVNLHRAVAEKTAFFHHIACTKGIDLVNQVDPGLTLHTDPDCLAVVLHNVLDNALKFTTTGCIRVTSGQSEDCVRLEVADTGHGMSREYMEWCNQPCTCPSGYLSGEGFRPTGLGLLLVRELLDKIGGRLAAGRSAQGGTVVVIEFNLI
jgi:signal transduction histidine kinase